MIAAARRISRRVETTLYPDGFAVPQDYRRISRRVETQGETGRGGRGPALVESQEGLKPDVYRLLALGRVYA